MDKFPTEVWMGIVRALDVESFLMLRRTNKYFYGLLSTDYVARDFQRLHVDIPLESDHDLGSERSMCPHRAIVLHSDIAKKIATGRATITHIREIEHEAFHYNDGIISYIRQGWICTMDIYTSQKERRGVMVEELRRKLGKELNEIAVLHYSCGIVTIWASDPGIGDGASILVSIRLTGPEPAILNTIRTSGGKAMHFIRNTSDTIFHGQEVNDDDKKCLITRYRLGGARKILGDFTWNRDCSWQVIIGGYLYLAVGNYSQYQCRRIQISSDKQITDSGEALFSIDSVSIRLIRGSPWLAVVGYSNQDWSWNYHTREIFASNSVPWHQVLKNNEGALMAPHPFPSPAFEMLFGVGHDFFGEFRCHLWRFTRSGALYLMIPWEISYRSAMQHDERSIAYIDRRLNINIISFDSRVKRTVPETQPSTRNIHTYTEQMEPLANLQHLANPGIIRSMGEPCSFFGK